MPRDLCSSSFSHLTPQEELKTLCFISPLLTSYPGSGQQKLDHVLANHCGCRLEPSRSASTVGCAELTFTACLALFSTFFLLFFFFFLPLLTQSNVSHIFSMPAISPASPCAAPSLSTQVAWLSCRWLCSCVVLHLGASGPSGVILSLLLGHYLGITITVGGRSPVRRDQIEGGTRG